MWTRNTNTVSTLRWMFIVEFNGKIISIKFVLIYYESPLKYNFRITSISTGLDRLGFFVFLFILFSYFFCLLASSTRSVKPESNGHDS